MFDAVLDVQRCSEFFWENFNHEFDVDTAEIDVRRCVDSFCVQIMNVPSAYFGQVGWLYSNNKIVHEGLLNSWCSHFIRNWRRQKKC